jgi:hypothetical protein
MATGGVGGRRSGAKGGQKWPIDGGPPAVALRYCMCSVYISSYIKLSYILSYWNSSENSSELIEIFSAGF